MATTLILLFILRASMTTGSDPCIEHTVIDDYNADRGIHGTRDIPLCDASLETGWYRVISPAGGDMVNTCPNRGSCSTASPVWMEGNPPSLHEGIVNRKAFSHLYNTANWEIGCRGQSYPIKIKNCTHFNVYHLVKIAGCYQAYCFGDKAPCPEGTNSPTGREPGCTESFPVLNQEAWLNFTVDFKNNTRDNMREVIFLCGLSDMTNISDQVTFLVRWYFNWDQIGLEVELTKADMPHRLHENDWGRKFGITFHCDIRIKTPVHQVPSVAKRSNRLYAGFEILTPTLSLEEGDIAEVRVRATVPIIKQLNLKYGLQVEVVIPKRPLQTCPAQHGRAIGLVAPSDRCGFEMDAIGPDNDWEATWEEIYNNPAVVNVTTTVNPMTGQPTSWTMVLKMKTMSGFDHPPWRNVALPSVQVYVSERGSATSNPALTCQSNNDPHMVTFDGCRYENHRRGEFIMYRHKSLPLQVNVFYQSCRGGWPSCNCAAMIRSGRDLFMIDVCKKHANAYTRIGFFSCQDGSLVVHKRADDYYITLPTGTVVQVLSVSRTTIGSVYVRPSTFDFERSEGLCGFHDNNRHNDFHAKGENKPRPSSCPSNRWDTATNPFTKSWLVVSQKDSLWNGIKRDLGGTLQRYCQCVPNGGLSPTADCGYHKAVEGCVDWGRDVTKEQMKRCEIATARRARAVSTGSDFGSMVAPPFEFEQNNDTSPPDWTNGWTEENARDHCRQQILHNHASQQCGTLENTDQDSFVSQCIDDIKLSGSTEWTSSSVNGMRAECRNQVLTNVTTWVGPKPPSHITSALCPHDCHQRGVCEAGICRCQDGFGNDDCSLDLTQPPNVTSVPEDGRCDVTRRPCRVTQVFGGNFVETNLTCKVEYFTITDDGLIESATSTINEGIFMNFGEVVCPLYGDVTTPAPPEAEILSEELPPIARVFKVSLSNGANNFSDPVVVLTFDGRCQECDVAKLECSLKDDTCRIGGECYTSGYTSPSNPCLVCDPATSQTQWTAPEMPSCAIDATCREDGEPHPDIPCHACNATSNPTGWSIRAGTCYINNQCMMADERNSSDTCLRCSPEQDNLNWTRSDPCPSAPGFAQGSARDQHLTVTAAAAIGCVVAVTLIFVTGIAVKKLHNKRTKTKKAPIKGPGFKDVTEMKV